MPGSPAAVRLPRLDEPAAADAAVVGGKAARLAAAGALGLPVLPGAVVPASFGVDALTAGAAEIDARGAHAAQLAVMSHPTDLDWLPPLVADLGAALVVRSSSPLEASTAWSGAFTSYLDVAPDELPTAVRGVWASALGRDALDRSRHAGVDPAATGIAALVQPHLRPDVSGTAAVDPDGTVTVVAVAGSPERLMHGWDPGHTVRVDPQGAVDGEAGPLDRELLGAVADLARRVRARLGDDLVEWASAGGEPVLLQCATGERRDAAPEPSLPADTALDAGTAVRRLHEAGTSDGARFRSEPEAYLAVMRQGRRVRGVPAAPGTAAGPAVLVDGAVDATALPPRAVVVAPRPLPHLAPLLWGASALVTFGGSPAAHLVEVARSLNLPAVVGCRGVDRLLAAARASGVAAVDGTNGVVSTWTGTP